jgi:four helix bundle protein
VSENTSGNKLLDLATAAEQATQAECAKFPPFEGLALSVQLKKAAKSAVAHIGEGYGRHNAGDRVRLLGLSAEAIGSVQKGLENALKSKLIKQPEFDKLIGEWAAVLVEIDTYISFLETGGEMESPLPGV